MANRISVTLLAFAATLIQCYATRTGDGCAPLSVHATMAECRALASEYRKFDARALSVTGLPWWSATVALPASQARSR